MISILNGHLSNAGAIVFGGVLSMAEGDPAGTIAATVVLAVMGYMLVLVAAMP
ncbi:hypothetical protein [Antarctobacter sp.]|uniref:hypothetical protein n=1 Tax=Antarctobacter sp. TaxID=1872577 RepID=UPI003A8F61B6